MLIFFFNLPLSLMKITQILILLVLPLKVFYNFVSVVVEEKSHLKLVPFEILYILSKKTFCALLFHLFFMPSVCLCPIIFLYFAGISFIHSYFICFNVCLILSVVSYFFVTEFCRFFIRFEKFICQPFLSLGFSFLPMSHLFSHNVFTSELLTSKYLYVFLFF